MISSDKLIQQYKGDLQQLLYLRNTIFRNLIEGYTNNAAYYSDLE